MPGPSLGLAPNMVARAKAFELGMVARPK